MSRVYKTTSHECFIDRDNVDEETRMMMEVADGCAELKFGDDSDATTGYLDRKDLENLRKLVNMALRLIR